MNSSPGPVPQLGCPVLVTVNGPKDEFKRVCLSLENEHVTKAERFDTVENKWDEMANMQQQRLEVLGVAF